MRHLVVVTSDELEAAARHNNVDIEIDPANHRAYVRIEAVTLVAELADEVCS